MATRIGVDIGGTFTDLIVYDDQVGVVTIEKTPTTPASPEQGCVEAVRLASQSLGSLDDCEYFLHGTTVGLNALLERRGAKVGLLCTEGFRDVLEIGRGSRPEGYDLSWLPPKPLVPRHLRLPVGERIDAQGAVLRPIERTSIEQAAQTFRTHDVTAVAVCLMNSYVNPAHEEQVEQLLREFGFDGEISLSHRLSREYRDYERTSTTVVDAFVRSRMARYLDSVDRGIQELGFTGTSLITRSGGGSMTFDEGQERSFETINSGPVAGVEGAAELARAFDLGDLVTADVGGTSFDTALVMGGRPQLLHQGEVADMPIQAPWVDVRSVGAGGGSLAHVDAGGLLQVGPRSSGAEPGPACYGRGGTEATVTDAAFYLGMLGTGQLASGLNLDKANAERALQALADALRTSVRAVAVGIIQIACASCANAVREITVEQGIDPRTLSLFAFGGAGPLLATQVARELGIRRVLIPPLAGNFSAWGLLGSDLVRSTSRTQRFALTEDGVHGMSAVIAEMLAELEGRSTDRELGRPEVGIGLRFTGGQEHSLTVAVPWSDGRLGWGPAEIEHAFRAAYRSAFGMTLEHPVEAIVLRTAFRNPLERNLGLGVHDDNGGQELPTQDVYSFVREADLTARTLQWASLRVGEEHEGPAVIYDSTTTSYVDAGFTYRLDANGCLVLTCEE
jgi:N-methylhydantoinase A